MLHRNCVLAILVVLGVVLSSAGAATAQSSGTAAGRGTATPGGEAPLAVATDIVPLPGGTPLVPLVASTPIPLTLTLAPSHPGAWNAFLSAVDDPSSPLYRHFLTYSEYLREYAPSSSEETAVVDALAAAGGSGFTVTPDRAGVSVDLPASAVDRLFGVTLEQYGTEGGVPLFSAAGPFALPPALRGSVVGVDGLSYGGDGPLRTNLESSPLRPLPASSSPGLFVYNVTSATDWYVGSDYTQAYGATGLFPGNGLPNATYPSRVAIATLLASGYNETMGENLPPWDPSVVETYFNQTFPAAWPKPVLTGVPVSIGTATPPPPGSFGAATDDTLDEIENSLDLEMAGSMAPGASVYNFYFAGSLLAGSSSIPDLAGDFAQSLSDALAYNYSPDHLGVISGSFGLPDLNETLWNSELGVAAATGVTVVFASGDQGNAPDSDTGRTDGQWPVWPATAAFNTSGAISVGGVTLSLVGQPTSVYNGQSLNLSYDATVRGFENLSAWYDAPPGEQIAGSEGGVSSVYPEPSWQFDSAAQWPIVNATETQQSSALGRTGPDVALSANNTIATVLANATGAVFFSVLEGTSVAAPLLAGLIADVVGVESARSASGWAPLGFLTPELYRIASYYAANPSAPGNPFVPVVTGHNYVFRAAPGWNPTTGWGMVNASLLLAADGNASVRDYAYSGPTPGLPPGHSTSGFPWPTIIVILAVGVVAAVVIVLLAVVRPSRRAGPPGVPSGVVGAGGAPFGPGTQGGIYPGATFLCPYCGAVRPAEPVRCAQCGAL